MQMTGEDLDPDQIQPWHDFHNSEKIDRLVESMTTHGWRGAPLVVMHGDGFPVAITGSHRIEAARRTNTHIPTIDLDDLLSAHGLTLAEIDEKTGSNPGDELHYESIVRLDYHLPADVVAYYGLDAH